MGMFAKHDPRSFVATLAAGFLAGVALLGTIWSVQAGVFGGGGFTLKGSLTLMESSSGYSSSYSSSSISYSGSGGSCFGLRGYSDIGSGAAVNVYDTSGAVVAIGRLDSGTGTYGSGCTFTFSVPDVPRGSDFYQVEVSHRGKINLAADDAQAGRAAFTLGG